MESGGSVVCGLFGGLIIAGFVMTTVPACHSGSGVGPVCLGNDCAGGVCCSKNGVASCTTTSVCLLQQERGGVVHDDQRLPDWRDAAVRERCGSASWMSRRGDLSSDARRGCPRGVRCGDHLLGKRL